MRLSGVSLPIFIAYGKQGAFSPKKKTHNYIEPEEYNMRRSFVKKTTADRYIPVHMIDRIAIDETD